MTPRPPRPGPLLPLLAIALFTVVPLTVALPAAAHHVWLVPADPAPTAGKATPVELRVGHRFPGERLPRNEARIVRFALLGPDGERAVPGVPGTAPAGIVRPGSAGDHAVVYRGTEARLELPADRFRHYLEEQGFEAVVRRRDALGESDRPGREVYSRSLKALITAAPASAAGTAGETSPGNGTSVHLRPTGLDLELVPMKRPADLAPGDALPLRLLFRGAPRAGVRVTAGPATAGDTAGRETAGSQTASDGPRPFHAVTDSRGRVRIPLSHSGLWQLTAVVMERADDVADSEWRSVWTSLTFTVPLAAGERID